MNKKNIDLITKIIDRIDKNKQTTKYKSLLQEKTYYSIIASHQARLRCFLHNYIYNKNIQKGEVHRFQNGSIIKFLVSSKIIEIELLYNGEIDEEKPSYKYYVKPNTEDPKAKEGKYQIVPFNKIILQNTNIPINNDKTYIFYLIRHGQAEHNILKGINKLISKKDTNLTKEGIQQAKNSGKYMLNILNNNRIDFLFASDLSRTHQTIHYFLSEIPSNKVIVDKIIVLPCNHELKYSPGSNCDGHQYITANENISTCELIEGFKNSCFKIGNRIIDWTYYNNFYNGTRKHPGSDKDNCRNTNVILFSIQTIYDVIVDSIGKYIDIDTDTDINTYEDKELPIKKDIINKNDDKPENKNIKDDTDIDTYKEKFNKNKLILSLIPIIINNSKQIGNEESINIENKQVINVESEPVANVESEPAVSIDNEEEIINQQEINNKQEYISEIPKNNEEEYINNEYNWKSCKEYKNYENSQERNNIIKTCNAIINNKSDFENWKLVTILNNNECILYNTKTKNNEIISLNNTNNNLIEVIVKSLLRTNK